MHFHAECFASIANKREHSSDLCDFLSNSSCGFFFTAYSAFKMTGSSSGVNDPKMSPRPSPRGKTGSFRKTEKAPERKDTDSIGSDTRSRSGSMSSVDSSDQLQEGRGKFERVC